MKTKLIHQTWVRILQKFGMGVIWACVFGFGLGAASFWRVERWVPVDDARWFVIALSWIDRLELWTLYSRLHDVG